MLLSVMSQLDVSVLFALSTLLFAGVSSLISLGCASSRARSRS